jgi:hypothetical protein
VLSPYSHESCIACNAVGTGKYTMASAGLLYSLFGSCWLLLEFVLVTVGPLQRHDDDLCFAALLYLYVVYTATTHTVLVPLQELLQH